jgi:ketosteroid isomerase-like protein
MRGRIHRIACITAFLTKTSDFSVTTGVTIISTFQTRQVRVQYGIQCQGEIMRKALFYRMLWAVMFCVGSSVAQADQTITNEIIALVKSEWAAEQNRNIVEKIKNTADDYTEFNDFAPTRVDGKTVAARLEEAGWKDSKVYVATEMLNPKVQVYGDTAILTYNFAGFRRNKDGKLDPDNAKVTRVYVKQAGKWMLVHAHF